MINLKTIWKTIKSLIGEDAYEKYLEHQAKSHPDSKPLSKKDFYKQDTERKWNGIRRCC